MIYIIYKIYTVYLGLVGCLIFVLVWLKLRKFEKELKLLNEKTEGLLKEKKDAKRQIQMVTKQTQTSSNADDEKVKINIFHPRYSSTPITCERPSSNTTRKINNNIRKRKSGIPRSTTFPQPAQLAVEDEFQSEFSIPIPFDGWPAARSVFHCLCTLK